MRIATFVKGTLVLYVLVVGSSSCSRGVEVSSTPTVTQVASSTNIPPTATITKIPLTASPTRTMVPSLTPTATQTLEPTVVPTALSAEGYTFFGTQIKFLMDTFGWDYEPSSCGNSVLIGVRNVLPSEPGVCPRLTVPVADRTDGSYLIEADYWWLPPERTDNVAVPFDHRFYVYKGDMIDSGMPWLDLNESSTIEAITGGYNFVWEKSLEIGALVGTEVFLPSPVQIFPLTSAEYQSVSSRPDLFPQYLESAAEPRK